MGALLSSLGSLLSGGRRIREASTPANVLEKRKLLHLFVAPQQLGNYQKFVDTLYGKMQTITVPVPGSKTNEILVRSSDISRLSTAKVTSFILCFHQRGYCFGGNITEDDLWLSYMGDLRVSLRKFDELHLKTDAGQRRDASIVAQIIRCHLFNAVDSIPEDIESLLNLLESYTPELIEAVLQHPSLKSEVDALTQFQQLYMEFHQLSKTQPEKFKRIVGAMPYCEGNEMHWKLKSRDNDHLWKHMTFQQKNLDIPSFSATDLFQFHRIWTADESLKKFAHEDRTNAIKNNLSFIQKKGSEKYLDPSTDREIFFKICLADLRVSYGHEGDELLKNIRNNGQHMVEGCSVQKFEAECTILFKYFQVQHIVGFYYPRLLCDFFLAMHKEGCVPSSSNKGLSYLISQCQ